MMACGEFKVHVTYFESPSNFYFRFEDSEERKARNKSNLSKIESEVSRVAKTTLGKSCARVVGSIVGYLHHKWLSWERIKIIKVHPNGSLKVFLCDRGYFINIFGGQEIHLIDLPSSLQMPSEIIQQGSLALQPSDRVHDRETLEIVNCPVRYWNQKAIAFVQKFNPKKGVDHDWRLVLIKSEAGITYGDLLLKSPLETTSLSEELIKMNLAVPSDGMKLEPKPRSLLPSSNFKKILMNCCPELVLQKAAQKSVNADQKSQAMLPVGVEIGRFSNAKGNEKVKVPKKEVRTSNRPDRRDYQEIPNLTLDMFVFGQQVRPAFISIESTTFNETIKGYLKTSFKISKVQSHAWPQIASGRSVIVIPGGNSPLSPMTFLPPVINNLSKNCKAEASGVGPAVVIIASASEIKDIHRTCLNLASFLKIEVLGMKSKAVQLINGCDLLLSTPPAFVHTVEGTKIDLFKKDRIRTLIFHGIEQMELKFDSEVNEIVRRCSYGPKNVDKNPQIIVTSNMWFKNIAKFVCLIDPRQLIFCVESSIEVAALTGMKIVLEISSSSEAKFESMYTDLESERFKRKRTAVLVNDESSFTYLIEKLSKTPIKIKPAHPNSFEIDKTNWLREEAGEFSVLIATDATIAAMKLNQIQNLVHFSIPKTWSTFAQRFSTLMLSFYECLQKKIEPSSIVTKIFIDEAKNIKEFLHLVKFMHTRKMDGIPQAMIETVKILQERDEHQKLIENVPICERIWMFGKCTEYPCLFRHSFSAEDAPSRHFESESTIKFKVVNVLNPANYVIKVLSQKIGASWSSLEEASNQTEALLSKELQEFCACPENLKPTGIVAQESYLALCGKLWKRCKATTNVEPNNPLCKMYLIDEGIEVHCKSSNIHVLPDQFKEQRPLVSKLCILNLVPLHGENCWPTEANKKIAEMMNAHDNGFVLTADIKFAVQNTIFCSSISTESSGRIAMRVSLLKKLADFCVVDERVGKRLEVLLKKAFLIPESSSSGCDISELKPSQMATRNCTTEIDDSLVVETWKQLSWKSFYDVRVCHFKNPDSFFAVLAANQNKWLQDIDDDSGPLNEICVGKLCLLKKDKMLRGKILEVNDESIKVFLVDTGDIVECQTSELYKMSPKTISRIRFQSVHCRFVGVRPKYNMKTWPPKQCEAIEMLIRELKTPLRMYVLQKIEKIDDLCIPGQSSYEVILIDPSTGTHLDDLVVTQNYADRDPYDKPEDLEDVCGNASKLADNENEDMLKRMLESINNEFLESAAGDETETSFEEVEPSVKNVATREDSNTSENLARETQESNPVIPLSFLVKHPQIVWQQNEVKVHLSISAIDCVDYGMKIGDTTLEVTVLYANSRYEKAIIDLYCGIVPKLCSHELRGLNIIADLVKKEKNVEWPRLTESKERSQFIRFSNENIQESSNPPRKGIPAEEMPEPNETIGDQNFWRTEQLEMSEEEDINFY